MSRSFDLWRPSPVWILVSLNRHRIESESLLNRFVKLPRKRRRSNFKCRGKRRSSLEPLETRIVLDSTVVFSEIMYNPAGDTDDTLEWVELHNQMSKDMDISNWSIEGGINFAFPEGTAVSGDDYVVVAIDPSAIGTTSALGPFSGSLANDGEELRLVSNNGRVMNVVNYRDDGHWPVGPDGSGCFTGQAESQCG